jgi:hypothetical protein
MQGKISRPRNIITGHFGTERFEFDEEALEERTLRGLQYRLLACAASERALGKLPDFVFAGVELVTALRPVWRVQYIRHHLNQPYIEKWLLKIGPSIVKNQ